MQLQFSNRHIAFALSAIWQNLDYKFKYTVNQQITANPSLDYVQTLEVPEGVLLQIFSALTVEPEGVASFINHEMEDLLLSQINAVSNLADVQAGTIDPATNEVVAPNEGARLLIAISQIDTANKAVLESKIQMGLSQILA
jgi:hypothetical protein